MKVLWSQRERETERERERERMLLLLFLVLLHPESVCVCVTILPTLSIVTLPTKHTMCETLTLSALVEDRPCLVSKCAGATLHSSTTNNNNNNTNTAFFFLFSLWYDSS